VDLVPEVDAGTVRRPLVSFPVYRGCV